MSDQAESSLGDRLLEAVQNLWREVIGQGKVVNHQGQEIEALKVRMSSLERQLHGLKTARGRAIASNARLKASIAETETKLHAISDRLN
jgi:phage shock protein A